MASDTGATAIIVAIVLPMVLIGMAAMTVDVGRLYAERRELQNGADAASLALAQICAKNSSCGAGYLVKAEEYADANAQDGTAAVTTVCGTAPGLPQCTTPPQGVTSGIPYVHVETNTVTGATAVIPPVFGRALDPSYNGTTVWARATAAYGAPSAVTASLPITISKCEYDAATGPEESRVFAPPPPYPPYPGTERVLYFHDTTQAGSCSAGPSGAQIPGGFGWLQSSDCTAYSDTTSPYPFRSQPGRPLPSSCPGTVLASYVGKTVVLPVFDVTNDLNGSNGGYKMYDFVAFHLTGYSINGQDKVKSIVTNQFHCSGQTSCIYGYFTTEELASGLIGGPPSGGVTVVQLIG